VQLKGKHHHLQGCQSTHRLCINGLIASPGPGCLSWLVGGGHLWLMDTTGALACVDTAATCRSGLYAPGAGLRDRRSCSSQPVHQTGVISKPSCRLHNRLHPRAFQGQQNSVPHAQQRHKHCTPSSDAQGASLCTKTASATTSATNLRRHALERKARAA
jgi:hypothetical protein